MEDTTTTRYPLSTGNSAADSTLNKAASSVHNAVNKAAHAADEAVSNVKPAIDRVAQAAHQAVTRAAEVARPTADWLSEQGGHLKETERKAVADAGKVIAAHPWKSMGIALLAGFIASRFVR